MRISRFTAILSILIISYLLPAHLYAQSSNDNIKTTVKPLNLKISPSTSELMAAGQLGGLLFPTRNFRTGQNQVGDNSSFGKAIQEWNKHNYRNAVQLFKTHINDFPDSPWKAEAVLHVGCDAHYNGRYREAEESFRWIINNEGKSVHSGSMVLKNKARSRLAVLKVLENNLDEAISLFRELKGDSFDWRDRTYASHWIQRLSRYKSQEMALLTCGTQALATILRQQGLKQEAVEVLKIEPPSFRGLSLKNLQEIAAGYNFSLTGRQLSVSELGHILLPAILHIAGRDGGDKGHFWILEEINNGMLTFYDPQIPNRFHQQLDEFEREWNGIAMVFSDEESLPGSGLTESALGEIFGGCCGVQRPESDLGDPGNWGKTGVNNSTNSCGAPAWSVNVINMNLFVTDTPLWYKSPIGPSVEINLSYNSQSAIANNEPFGNKWSFNYGSYLVVDTSGTVTVFMPDGRRDTYVDDGQGGFSPPYKVYNKLTKIAENHFELRFPDDTVYEYAIPQGTSSLQPFLVEIRDAYDLRLLFGYNTDVKLTTITDAVGRTTILTYNQDGLVIRVADPFGRTADFEYDDQKNLTRITDMGGYWSSLSYDTDIYLTSIGNSSGSWDFFVEPADGIVANSDNYPPPNDDMWENYRITITNPLGNKEEFFYYAGCDEFTCDGYTWYVSPSDYLRWESQTVNNYKSKVPKTRYFFTPTSSGKGNEISSIRTPEGKREYYTYDSSGNQTGIGDSHGHWAYYSYNDLGKVTSKTDARNTLTSMTYAPNGFDLIEVQDTLGTMKMEYNSSHDITAITDRLNNTSSISYNNYGQVATQTDALGKVIAYNYDVNNRLQQKIQSGQTLESFTYDSLDRLKDHTDATGLTLTHEYNNLNNIIKTTYSDGKFISYSYITCCPHLLDSETDRSGRTTSYEYDALKRRVAVINPEGGTTQNSFDANGNRTVLKDANGNVTEFEYDLDNRLVMKTYGDGKSITYQYDTQGLLLTRTNARGNTATYSYDANHNRLNTIYSDGTPCIINQYDLANRLMQRQDGTGIHQYTYDANSRVTGLDGPWLEDTITYSYDLLDRRIGMGLENGRTVSYTYDTFDRLNAIEAGGSSFGYTYTGPSPLVQSLVRTDNSSTTYQYDGLNRLLELSNQSSTSSVLSQYNYTYNAQDMRATETIINGSPQPSLQNDLKTYNYNRVNQLLSSASPSETFVYDDDGNMTQGYTPEGFVFTAAYDAENRLQSIQYTDGENTIQRTEYLYNGDGFLLQEKKFENSSMVKDTLFIRDGYFPLQERDANNSVINEYLWGKGMGGGIGGLLYLKQGAQGYQYLYDGKGNVTSIIDQSQTKVASYRYDTFGNLVSKTVTVDQPFQFSTKAFDEETGLSYYGYRFYSPSIARWLSRDPIGERVGENLYSYVRNNPIKWVDPYGLSDKDTNSQKDPDIIRAEIVTAIEATLPIPVISTAEVVADTGEFAIKFKDANYKRYLSLAEATGARGEKNFYYRKGYECSPNKK